MPTKVYKIARACNNMSFVLYGKSGNSLRYEFTGGSVVTNTPARLMLRTKYAQDLLESSIPFLEKDVILERTDEDTHEEESAPVDLIPVKGVTTVSEAIDYVAKNFSVVVKTARQAKTTANKFGYDFPDLKTKE